VVVLDTTPFYAEAAARWATRASSVPAPVWWEDTQKIKADVFGHHGSAQTQGTLKVGDAVTAQVDAVARAPPCATTASRT
jgi:alanyl-tRNA synthetase